MRVLKRNGTYQNVQFDKITARLESLCKHLNHVNIIQIAKEVVSKLSDGISTRELDVLSAEICISYATKHPEYSQLAGIISISNHHKNTSDTFSNVIEDMYHHVDIHSNASPLISKECYDVVQKYKTQLNSVIDYERDYLIDYFGFKTLQKSYLKKINNVIVERPQHMWMRVSIGIHMDDIDRVFETYHLLSTLHCTHATPTLFHAGSDLPQMSSCFLMGTEDSVDGIYKTITDCARISKWAGGIGCHISNIRARGSYIRKTSGYSDGILPMLKVYNHTARYINQAGKRNGSFAMYLEPWHADVFDFLEAKKNHGSEEERARDLFYALWIPDRFMKEVKQNGDWYLMCPDESPGLHDVVGDAFDALYDQYIRQKKYKKQIKAREVWKAIIDSQIETGAPYMLYKDACNRKSNQQNVGVIKSSNLCTEIIEYSDDKEYAVCNLASIALPKFILQTHCSDQLVVYTKQDCSWCVMVKLFLDKQDISYDEIIIEDIEQLAVLKRNTVPFVYNKTKDTPIGGYEDTVKMYCNTIDHDALFDCVRVLTKNLNKIIDINHYPVPETRRSNMRHRPIGLGVQGLADVFMNLQIPFASSIAKQINRDIFETIYYASLHTSHQLATVDGPYETFFGSPISKGKFQFDLWDVDYKSTRWNWNELREHIMRDGIRNSLLVAPMPTASTSQILGNQECIEPYTSNMFTRRTMAGEFTVINKWLLHDLIRLDMWNEEMEQRLIYHRGSIQSIPNIPSKLKEIYKTSWEMKQRDIIDMAADRAIFIDQSQSLNLFIESPNLNILSKCHFYSWEKGLKTGSYYIRSKPSMNAQQFTVEPELEKKFNQECEMCGS